MNRQDRYWCLGGLVLGLLIAANTARQAGFTLDSFNAGRLTGNVLGGVLAMWGLGCLIARLRR